MHKPVNTRDTAVRVRGVSRCAKNLDRTRTRSTRFGSTAGLTVPVLNASHGMTTAGAGPTDPPQLRERRLQRQDQPTHYNSGNRSGGRTDLHHNLVGNSSGGGTNPPTSILGTTAVGAGLVSPPQL